MNPPRLSRQLHLLYVVDNYIFSMLYQQAVAAVAGEQDHFTVVSRLDPPRLTSATMLASPHVVV